MRNEDFHFSLLLTANGHHGDVIELVGGCDVLLQPGNYAVQQSLRRCNRLLQERQQSLLCEQFALRIAGIGYTIREYQERVARLEVNLPNVIVNVRHYAHGGAGWFKSRFDALRPKKYGWI